MRAQVLAFVVVVAGCHTTGSKIAGGIGIAGLGVETAGAVKGNETMLSVGMLMASVAALAWILTEAHPEGSGFSSETSGGSSDNLGLANEGSEGGGGVAHGASGNVNCRFGNCGKDGWTEQRSDGTSTDVSCRFGDCNKDGWTERRTDGSSTDVSCRFGDCSKDGWTKRGSDGTSSDVSCHFGDCNKDGWTERRSDGTSRDVSCHFGDCNKDGWTERSSDGTSITCTCNFGDCNANGVTCR